MAISTPAKVRSAQKYLMMIPSVRARGQIRKVFAQKWNAKHPDAPLPGFGRANSEIREILAFSIFEVENARESRKGGCPDDPLVVQMRQARHAVERDLGWG